MKHIFILGAGLMQQPAIKAAHELGYKVTVADGNPNAVCKDLADCFYLLDLKDTDGIVRRAKKLKKEGSLDGVFTAGTDFSYAVSCAAEACGLSAHSPKSAACASDKILMRSCFEKAGVPSPHFIELGKNDVHGSLQVVQNKLDEEFFKFPLVVKPCDNMGARGCRLVRTEKELLPALNVAIKYSRTGRAIVEEFMDGPEFSIDALVFDNSLTITGFADRHIFYPPYFIEMGHTMPTSISDDDYAKLIQTFYRGVLSLGLSLGAAKADIKLTSKGPMIGEIAARLSGGYMSGWTYPYASGLNLTKEALLLAAGEKPYTLLEGRKIISTAAQKKLPIYDFSCKAFSAERAWLSIPGKIESADFFDTASSISGIKNFFPRITSGQEASFPVNNVEKAGNIISFGESRQRAIAAAEKGIKTLFLRLSVPHPKTEKFLSQSLATEFPPSAFILPQNVLEYLDTIQEDETFFSHEPLKLPEFLQDCLALKDWNGRSLAETLKLFNKILLSDAGKIVQSFKINKKFFWHCLLRGGIQGAVYYADKLKDA